MTLADYQTHLRAYIKDNEALNILLDFTEENTDDELELYLSMGLSHLNNIPPHIGDYTFVTFPYTGLLILEAVMEVLISNGIVNQRNQLTYNDGGITVNHPDGDKYMKTITVLTRRIELFEKSFKAWKINLNVNAGWGGSYSPYATLNASDTLFSLTRL